MGKGQLPKLSPGDQYPSYAYLRRHITVLNVDKSTEGWFSSSFMEGFTCVPLLSRCKLLQDIGQTDLSEAERTLPFQKFQSSFSHQVSFLLVSPFPLFFSNWRMWETRERRSWRDEKERTILVPFISPIASCAAELKICNLVSKSISTLPGLLSNHKPSNFNSNLCF